MKLRVVWTGKTKDSHLRALAEGYLNRLNHFVRCEIIELRESVNAQTKVGIDKDSKRISDALKSATVVVLLDPEGRHWSSQQLAAELQHLQTTGIKEVAFVVGGPAGVSRQLREQVDKRWSLTRLTLTHEMARVVLLEQLYRAYTIINGLPYQK
jgi:23S rRNA (pseudouridine1915-N3)-methyltransferase